MTQSLTQAAKTTAKIAFAAGLIYWMIHTGALDFDVFAKLASPGLILFCAACIFGQIFVCNIRWLALMKGQGFDSSIRRTLPLSFIGMFFNFVMPGGVGGDVIKGYYLLQEYPRQKIAGAVSIFMDRMMGFFIMIATAFLALFFNWDSISHSPELKGIAAGVTGLFVCFLIFYFLSLSRVLQHSALSRVLFEKMPGGAQFKKLYESLHSYRRAPWALFWAGLLSVVNQALLVAFVYAIGQAMGLENIPLAVYFFLVPIGTVVQALPISPAGIGVGQAAFYFLFSLYLGQKSQLGPTAVTTQQLMNFGWGLVGAFFYLQRKKPPEVEHETEFRREVQARQG